MGSVGGGLIEIGGHCVRSMCRHEQQSAHRVTYCRNKLPSSAVIHLVNEEINSCRRQLEESDLPIGFAQFFFVKMMKANKSDISISNKPFTLERVT
jgi:hypothetical protein